MQPPCDAPPSSDPHSHQTNDCYRFFKKREEGRDAACAMATITSPLAVGSKVCRRQSCCCDLMTPEERRKMGTASRWCLLDVHSTLNQVTLLLYWPRRQAGAIAAVGTDEGPHTPVGSTQVSVSVASCTDSHLLRFSQDRMSEAAALLPVALPHCMSYTMFKRVLYPITNEI